MRILLTVAGQSLLLLGALFVCGYPVRRLLQLVIHAKRVVVATPLLGVYPVVQVSWIWLNISETGLHTVLPVTVVAFGFITAVLSAHAFVANRPTLQHVRQAFKARSGDIAVFVAVLGAYGLVFHYYLSLNHATPASVNSADIPHITVLTEFLRIHGFASAGSVFGMNLGSYVRGDTVGTFITYLIPAALLRSPVWTTTAGVVAAAWFLECMQLRALFFKGFRARSRSATWASVLAVIAPMTVFIVSQSFMSQLFGSALFFAGITVICRMKSDRRSSIGDGIQLAVVMSALLFVYPFMFFALPVVALGIRWLATRNVKDLLRPLVTIAAAGLLAVGLSGTRAPVAVAQAFLQGASTRDGYGLRYFLPNEVLGFTSSYMGALTLGALAGLFPVLAVALVSYRRLRRAPHIRYSLAGLAVGFFTHLLLFIRTGASYLQWKWAGVIAPMAVGALAVLVFDVVRLVLNSLKSEPVVSKSVTAVTGVILVIAYAVNSVGVTNKELNAGPSYRYITDDLAGVANDRFLRDQKQLVLKLNYWESMWAASFFPKATTYHSGYGDYYPRALAPSPSSIWTVESVDDLSPAGSITEMHPIDKTYRAVKGNPPRQVRIEALPGGIDTSSESVHWKVRVTNISQDTWIAPQAFNPEAAGLVVSAMLPNDVAGQGSGLVAQRHDYQVDKMQSGTSLAPGKSLDFEGSAPLRPRAGFVLVFEFRLDFNDYLGQGSTPMSIPLPARSG